MAAESDLLSWASSRRGSSASGARYWRTGSEHVSVTVGDGEGFVVLSFEADGSDRLIEVKTTV